MKLRVSWFPQVPCNPYVVPVDSVTDAVRIMNLLANYDLFQYANKIKPDYCNTGILEMFDPEDKEDGPEGSWVGWFDEETGEDDPEEYLRIRDVEGL